MLPVQAIVLWNNGTPYLLRSRSHRTRLQQGMYVPQEPREVTSQHEAFDTTCFSTKNIYNLKIILEKLSLVIHWWLLELF